MENITKEQADIIGEVANICTGTAATALSMIINLSLIHICLPLRRLSFSLCPRTLHTLRRRNYRPVYTAFLYSGCVYIPRSLPLSPCL